jgi:hypothetical protein
LYRSRRRLRVCESRVSPDYSSEPATAMEKSRGGAGRVGGCGGARGRGGTEEVESCLLGSRRGLAVARFVVLEVGPAEQLVGLPQRVLVERVAEPVEEALLLALLEAAVVVLEVAVMVVDAGSLSDDVKHAAVTTITPGAVLGSFEDMRFKSEFKKLTKPLCVEDLTEQAS